MSRGGRRRAELVGRDRELEAIGQFHDLRADGSAALVIGGDPGSGRTALLDAATAGEGFLVLRSRPQPEDASRPFTAIRDLLLPIFGAVDEHLSLPLRDALGVALLLRPADPQVEPGLVAPGLAATLEVLARDRAVLV